MYVFMRVSMYAYMYAACMEHPWLKQGGRGSRYECMYVCFMYVCMFVFTYMCVRVLYVCMHVVCCIHVLTT